MKRGFQLATGALALAVSASVAAAQDAPQPEGFFRKPTFVLMPGVVMAPVLSGVGDEDAGDTKTYVNARFMTVIPTRLPWFTALAGTQFLPNGPRAGGIRLNQPNIFYGGIISMPGVTEATGGWLALSIDPLGLYSFGGGGANNDVYGHDFVLEGAAVVNVGQKMMSSMPAFAGWSVYVLLDQVVTHAPRDPSTGDKDYWHPVALAGLTIPIGR